MSLTRFAVGLCLLLAALLSATAPAPAPAQAHDYKAGSLEIGHPWARATVPGMRAGAAFLTVANHDGVAADRLVAARTPAADKAELHEHVRDGDVMRMRPVAGGIEIPPGATVALAPGGLHIMLIGLKAPLAAGSRVPLTLVFERAGEVAVELAVGPLSAPAGEASHMH